MVEEKTQSGKSQKHEVTLPTEIIEGALTLEEIGALFILMALPYYDNDLGWDKNNKFKDIINHFIKEGIIIPNNKDNSVEIDLTWI